MGRWKGGGRALWPYTLQLDKRDQTIFPFQPQFGYIGLNERKQDGCTIIKVNLLVPKPKWWTVCPLRKKYYLTDFFAASKDSPSWLAVCSLPSHHLWSAWSRKWRSLHTDARGWGCILKSPGVLRRELQQMDQRKCCILLQSRPIGAYSGGRALVQEGGKWGQEGERPKPILPITYNSCDKHYSLPKFS